MELLLWLGIVVAQTSHYLSRQPEVIGNNNDGGDDDDSNDDDGGDDDDDSDSVDRTKTFCWRFASSLVIEILSVVAIFGFGAFSMGSSQKSGKKLGLHCTAV